MGPRGRVLVNRAEPSSLLLSRMTGGLLLVMAITAGFAELGVRQSLIVPGDAAATAARIAAAGRLFDAGFVGYLVGFLSDVPVAVLLYLLLRRTSPTTAMLAAAFRLVYTAIVAAGLVHFFEGGALLRGGASTALEPHMVNALALGSLERFDHAFSLALAFFGCHLVLLGGAMWDRRAAPRWLGVLLVVAGGAYLIDSMTKLVAPSVHEVLAQALGVPTLFELVLAIWLLVKGIPDRMETRTEGGQDAAAPR